MESIHALISSTEKLVGETEANLLSLNSLGLSEEDKLKLLELAERVAKVKEEIAKKKTILLMFLGNLVIATDIGKITVNKGSLREIDFGWALYHDRKDRIIHAHGESVKGSFVNVSIRDLVDHPTFPFEDVCQKIIELVGKKLEEDGNISLKGTTEFEKVQKEVVGFLEKIKMLEVSPA